MQELVAEKIAARLSDCMKILWPLNVAAFLSPFVVQDLTPPVIANGADVPVHRYSLTWSEAIPAQGLDTSANHSVHFFIATRLSAWTSDPNFYMGFSPIDSAKAVHYYRTLPRAKTRGNKAAVDFPCEQRLRSA